MIVGLERPATLAGSASTAAALRSATECSFSKCRPVVPVALSSRSDRSDSVILAAALVAAVLSELEEEDEEEDDGSVCLDECPEICSGSK